MRILYAPKTFYCFLISAVFIVFTNIAFSQNITTDKPDYPPGDTVIITGTGFAAGETVTVQVIHPDEEADNDSSDAHDPWDVVADGDGNVSTRWTVPADQDEGDAQLELLADGQSSGLHAEYLFTDAATPPPCAITGSSTGCSGGLQTFTANAGSGFTYQWAIINNNTGASISGSTSSLAVNVNVGNTVGTFTLRLTVISGALRTTCTKIVTTTNNPVPDITGSNAVCSGSSATFDAGSGYSSYTWSTGASTQTISANTAGTYSVTVVDANGCIGSAAQTLAVNANPSPEISGDDVICSGASTTFDAGAGYAGYAWSTAENTQTISVSAAGTYSVTVVDAHGCSGSGNYTLTVNANPTPAISGSNAVCSGASATFDAGAGYASYAWSTGANTQSISANAAGTYSVTVVDANGCSGSADHVLTVNANPTPASGSAAVCSGASATFDAGAGYASYSWSTGANTQTISANAAGTYSVTVVNANGCSGSGEYILTLNVNPTPAISGGNAVCDGASATFNAGAGYASYLWSNGASTQSISVNTAGTYSVTVTDANGCNGSASRTLTVNANPIAAITGAHAVCNGASATLNAGAGYASYLWSNGASTQSISVNTAGTYSVTVTNANGCVGSAEHTLAVNANPSPAMSGGDAVCSGGSAAFDAGAGYASYLWSNGASTQSISVNTTGTYSVTVTDANGCSGSAARQFTVNPKPTPAIAGNNFPCTGSTINLDAGAGYSSYLWSTGATTQAITVTAVGTYTVTVSNSNGCTGTASATVNDLAGNPITHNPYTDFNATPNSGTPSSLWLHVNTKLNNSTDLANNGDYIMITNGSITLNHITSTPTVTNVAIPDGKIIADNSVSSPTTSYDAANNIWITKVPPGYTSSNIFITAAIINSSTGFSVSSGKSSSVTATWRTNKFGGYSSSWFYGLAAYQPQFSYSNVSAAGQVASISSGVQAGTPIPEEGNLVGGGSGGGGSNYTGSNSSTDNFTISVAPVATASNNGPVIGGNDLSLYASGGTSYSWAGPNSFTSTEQNPSIQGVTYLQEGTYTVTATNAYGCTATATTTVDVTCKGFKSYTYTQTGWGATPSGNNAASYRNNNFPYAFPDGLNAGCGTNYLHLTTATAVQDFLPSTGTAAALAQSYTNPGATLLNTFAGQVVALALNVGFDNYDASFAITDAQLKDLYVKSGTFTGWTVQQVLDESEAKLGGCYSAYSVSQLNTACTNINQNYDGGTTDHGYLTCMPVRIENQPSVDIENSLNLYPNPNTGLFILKLNLNEEINSQVDIQIFNMLGELIYINQTVAVNGILNQEVKLDNNLPNGNYMVRVISGEQVFTQQIICQR